MQSSSEFWRGLALAALGVALVSALGGCAEYLDRRDTMTEQSGNAVQTNKITQMVDPWPGHSAERDIASNGAVMQTAITRYRTGRVIPPVGMNSYGSNGGAPSPPPPVDATPLGPTVNAQSGPVK